MQLCEACKRHLDLLLGDGCGSVSDCCNRSNFESEQIYKTCLELLAISILEDDLIIYRSINEKKSDAANSR